MLPIRIIVDLNIKENWIKTTVDTAIAKEKTPSMIVKYRKILVINVKKQKNNIEEHGWGQQKHVTVVKM